jgi:DNA-directed RNA polymerase specialized sigma24 family protein
MRGKNMIPQAELRRSDASAEFAEAYPVQYKKMLGFVRSKGVPGRDAHDVVNDAWAVGIGKYDKARGLAPVYWVWYVLEWNALPQYFRKRNQKFGETYSQREELRDTEMMEAVADPDAVDPFEESHELVEFLRKRLPVRLRELFDTLFQVMAEIDSASGTARGTDSKHIYPEVAKRLEISMPECRNRMKKLRRECARYKRMV